MEKDPEPTKADIDAMLELIPLFENSNRDHGEWGEFKGGHVPMFHLGSADSQFMERAYEHKFVYSFDWPSWKDEAERLTDDPEALKTADLDMIRKLITTHVRADRFCEGHLAGVSKSGHLLAILYRLTQIRESML